MYEERELTTDSLMPSPEINKALPLGSCLGPPISSSQGLQLGTNGDILVGRSGDGAILKSIEFCVAPARCLRPPFPVTPYCMEDASQLSCS